MRSSWFWFAWVQFDALDLIMMRSTWFCGSWLNFNALDLILMHSSWFWCARLDFNALDLTAMRSTQYLQNENYKTHQISLISLSKNDTINVSTWTHKLLCLIHEYRVHRECCCWWLHITTLNLNHTNETCVLLRYCCHSIDTKKEFLLAVHQKKFRWHEVVIGRRGIFNKNVKCCRP